MPRSPYLERIRKENKEYASKCFYCKKQSTTINAIKHRIIFVCIDHAKSAAEERTIDLSNPNVVHITYPNGYKVPSHMMDPNIGGYLGPIK